MFDMTNKNIKGLFLSEWYTMRVLFICVVVMVICGLLSNVFMVAATGEASIGFLSIFGGCGVMLLASSFAYDGMKCIGTFKKSMPYSEHDIVLARFMPPVIIAVFEVVFLPLGMIIGGLIHGSFSEGFAGQAAFVTVVNLFYVSVPVLIYYPLCFKFGYQKVQLFYSIFATILMSSSVVLSMTSITSVSDESGHSSTVDKAVHLSMPVSVCAVMIAVLAVLYVLAFRVSVKEYSKRDE